MRLILLGAPGCGKGTLAGQIVKNQNLAHISTGSLLRKHIANNTPVGNKAKSYMDKGLFVPDDVVFEVLEQELKSIGNDNFVLDGFPRNIWQAQQLDKIVDVDKVVLINVDYNTIIKRLSGRRTCSDCGKIFNISSYQSVECDVCGGILVQRTDDTQEVIKNRFKVYEDQTFPLIEYYRVKNKLVELDAEDSPEMTYQKFKKLLEK